ncbi:MAG: MarR family transcriptional regulator [Hyphomicrobiales bacterium]|nr:MarR family transcriptional regulator [Hyphomicrobiales bacterium]
MLKRSITYQLASIAEDGIGKATRIFESRFGWTVYEIRVLRLIRAAPGITFTELAQTTRFERTATSRMLSRLTKAGLVKRSNLAQDARRFGLTLTRRGEDLCDKADPLSLELETMMLEPLTAEQRKAFRAMVATVLEWVREGYGEKVISRFPEAQGGAVSKLRGGKEKI